MLRLGVGNVTKLRSGCLCDIRHRPNGRISSGQWRLMKPSKPMKIERRNLLNRNLLNLFPIQVIWPCLLIKTPARKWAGGIKKYSLHLSCVTIERDELRGWSKGSWWRKNIIILVRWEGHVVQVSLYKTKELAINSVISKFRNYDSHSIFSTETSAHYCTLSSLSLTPWAWGHFWLQNMTDDRDHPFVKPSTIFNPQLKQYSSK